jgi:hypothetical protein
MIGRSENRTLLAKATFWTAYTPSSQIQEPEAVSFPGLSHIDSNSPAQSQQSTRAHTEAISVQLEPFVSSR